MPQITVPIWAFVISQAFGVGMVLCEVIALSKKSKVTSLRLFVFTNLFSALMCGFLGDWLGLGLGISGIIRNSIFIWMENRRGKSNIVGYPLKILIFTVGLQLVAFAIMFTPTPFHILFMAVAPFQIWSVWSGGIHKLRIFGLAWSTLWFIHASFFMNVVTMFMCFAVIVSIVVFYVRYFWRRGSRQIVHY